MDIRYGGPQLPLVGNGATVVVSSPLIDLTQTWNDAGVTFVGLRFNATATASATGSLLLDLQTGGVSQFNIRKDGLATVQQSGSFVFSGRSRISSAINGNILLANFAVSDFGLLQLGGTTSSFPAFKRVGASVQVRLADDSNPAPLTADVCTAVSYLRSIQKTVATLTAAATAGAGSRSFVTDALAPAFGVAVTGGGAVSIPVYSDGTTWLVG